MDQLSAMRSLVGVWRDAVSSVAILFFRSCRPMPACFDSEWPRPAGGIFTRGSVVFLAEERRPHTVRFPTIQSLRSCHGGVFTVVIACRRSVILLNKQTAKSTVSTKFFKAKSLVHDRRSKI